ncbi:UDP-N-acetylmuramate dehydrogenase [Patiriisocius sp. Uisw_017]|uniref:UDP-N-acetylmuramate dehydrogenase n=1 Tax=Patiriisocius sp. Uisw_017 TaxID=3230968 RepID=UPI0039E7FC20
MNIIENISLKPYNTFGIDATARHFVSVTTVNELKEVLSLSQFKNRFILGGGSNMLLKNDIDALVIHIDLKGISVLEKTKSHVHLRCMAGENWHELVLFCIEHNYGGLENLSLIPGNVGTAPIQNIGAYGVEIKDALISCEALNIETGKIKTFTNVECNFRYRNSIFKTELKGKYIITSVTFQLSKKLHKLHTSYGAIENELVKRNFKNPTIKNVSDAVIAIRQSKLPDPKVLGNSGSFFKNPIISVSKFNQFSTKFPEAPSYKVSETEYKIPAGWLIEQAGFKGKRFGDAGVHKKQALVLVNYGNASGTEIWNLALQIQKKVKDLYDITIEAEVNVI